MLVLAATPNDLPGPIFVCFRSGSHAIYGWNTSRSSYYLYESPRGPLQRQSTIILEEQNLAALLSNGFNDRCSN